MRAKPTTPKPAPPKHGAPSWDLVTAFVPRAKLKEEGRVYAVELVTLPPLVLPTGRIFACDPYTMFGAAPFERAVRRGAYPVTLSVAKISGRVTDRRVGCAMVRFAKGPVAEWVNATKKGQKVTRLAPGYHYGYGVDAGVGCFGDASVLPTLDLVDEVVRANGRGEGFLYDVTARDLDDRRWGSAVLDPKTKANMLVFSSGFGDGVYPSYWGLSKSGKAVCLVTDFGVYPRPEFED